MHVEVRRPLCRAGSPLPPSWELQGLNSGHEDSAASTLPCLLYIHTLQNPAYHSRSSYQASPHKGSTLSPHYDTEGQAQNMKPYGTRATISRLYKVILTTLKLNAVIKLSAL